MAIERMLGHELRRGLVQEVPAHRRDAGVAAGQALSCLGAIARTLLLARDRLLPPLHAPLVPADSRRQLDGRERVVARHDGRGRAEVQTNGSGCRRRDDFDHALRLE
jgi:hypothetical protein